MNDDTLTILGRVATDPTRGQTASGVPVTNFRVASTARRFDQPTQRWVDAGTNWYSVAAFRQLGEHAKASLRTGDSVIVTGRLKIRSWEANGKHGMSVDIDAEAIGHDLRWGTTAFLSASPATASGEHAAPAIDSRATRGEIEGFAATREDPGGDQSADGAVAQDDLDVSWATSDSDDANADSGAVIDEPVPF